MVRASIVAGDQYPRPMLTFLTHQVLKARQSQAELGSLPACQEEYSQARRRSFPSSRRPAIELRETMPKEHCYEIASGEGKRAPTHPLR